MRDRREYHRNYMRQRRAQQKLGIKIIKPSKGDSLVMDSRQVTEIVGKEHKHLMRDIRGYVEVLELSPNLDSTNFFKPSTYTDRLNRDQPCFLLTKQGCELVGNKLTGEKGILFTATYVSRFNEMEKIIGQSSTVMNTDLQIASENLTEELELHLTAAKLSADILEVDRATMLQMLAAVHDHYGIPTTHLLEHREGD